MSHDQNVALQACPQSNSSIHFRDYADEEIWGEPSGYDVCAMLGYSSCAQVIDFQCATYDCDECVCPSRAVQCINDHGTGERVMF